MPVKIDGIEYYIGIRNQTVSFVMRLIIIEYLYILHYVYFKVVTYKEFHR